MLDQLKFVKGAVSKKDLVPALTHFLIRDGRITGYNGKISITSPIALDVDCCPKADKLVKAIEQCSDTVQMQLTPTGKLSVRSGKFKALVECVPEDMFPAVRPEGVTVVTDGNLLPALKALYGFTSEDASRPWAAGVLLDGVSAYATNNVIMAECWLGYHFPFRVNIPRYAVKEIIRINEEPTHIQLTSTSATFHYSDERWLRTQLVSNEWPDTESLFSRIPQMPGMVPEVPEGLFEALDALAPFTDEASRVFFLNGRIATAQEEGTEFEVAGLPDYGAYNHKMFCLLEGIATRMGFEVWPAPVPWFGPSMRGLFMGLKTQ